VIPLGICVSRSGESEVDANCYTLFTLLTMPNTHSKIVTINVYINQIQTKNPKPIYTVLN